MTARSRLRASAACMLALVAASSASAQQSANQGPLTYLGKSATTVVMASVWSKIKYPPDFKSTRWPSAR